MLTVPPAMKNARSALFMLMTLPLPTMLTLASTIHWFVEEILSVRLIVLTVVESATLLLNAWANAAVNSSADETFVLHWALREGIKRRLMFAARMESA